MRQEVFAHGYSAAMFCVQQYTVQNDCLVSMYNSHERNMDLGHSHPKKKLFFFTKSW